MSLKYLNQTVYKNDDGFEIPASKIDFIAPYNHIADGFYHWECANPDCHFEHASRSCGWSIAGQVLQCRKCGKMNLLVKTNTEEINKAFSMFVQNEETAKELNRLQNIERQLETMKNAVKNGLIHRLRPCIDRAIDDFFKSEGI